MLVDTHVHLNFPDYEKDLDTVVTNAGKNGVTKIICVSSNLSDSLKAIEIAKKYPDLVYAAVGIHPQQTDPENTQILEEQIVKLETLAKQPEVVAIGECGLDYIPAPPEEKDRSKEDQLFLFKQQIELSLKLKLSLIIHSRKALNETINILKTYFNQSNQINGVFHCYAGGKSEIKNVLKIGFYFGVAGNLTYDEGLQNVVKQIPEKFLVLETDSPFLSPHPYRGLRNEPQNVRIIAECISLLKDIPYKELTQTTSSNAQNVFPKIR